MVLQTIWFFLWGLLWAVFFMTDGFDFGIGTMYPFAAKDDREKRLMLNAMGPLWDGNEVWLIAAGGVTFAAFPLVYATMFSTLYTALMLILFALILRGVAIEFRSKMPDSGWRQVWDVCIFAGSFGPAFLFGVAFANIYRGIPIGENGAYYGNFFMLVNTYGVIGGLHFLLLFLVHGALWMAMRTEGPFQNKMVSIAGISWIFSLIVTVIFVILTRTETGIFNNYIGHPMLLLLPLIVLAAFIAIKVYLSREDYLKAWLASALTIVGGTFSGLIGLFPNLFPSSVDPSFSLTAYNASSSPLTLKIMLIVVILFVPIIIGYQTWAYRMFMGKLEEEDIHY